MAVIRFNCSPEKTTQGLNFFAIRAGGSINKLQALKLIFFADRYHLRKYGRLITNDTYMAMEHGPVPSHAKEIAESNYDYSPDLPKAYCNQYIANKNNLSFQTISPLDESVFSDSDIEALNFAWDKFGKLGLWKLRDLTHEYPEWKKHKEALDSGVLRVPMDLEDFFEDPEADVEICFELNNREREIRREELNENAQIESLWG